MFSSVYFLFPKIFFTLFFYLACESLCPLKKQMIMLPRSECFSSKKPRQIWWMWLSKWMMIIMFIIAAASPVSEIELSEQNKDVMIVADSYRVDEIIEMIESSSGVNFGFFVPLKDGVIIAPTADKKALVSMIRQIDFEGIDIDESMSYLIDFESIVYSDNEELKSHFKSYVDVHTEREKLYRYYHFYPLFIGFLSMFIYLYGRNQRGFG